ncbi:ABC transporter ATP-binding protein [Aquibium sp. A9E412]|uniref:ABC transporter ATP-binding protein n=1 Tax=Aquibium sp. A9E412 TaxID=2976767 RepID=UPI0025AF0538|nr:ABC transporter ATP-binding protein [Aquibium sp. A9E412]MDN2566400.1 ABC transporter ATP-binding protein [Aquibium sp. A9E412]
MAAAPATRSAAPAEGIVLDEVSKRYGEVHAFGPVSFSIEDGTSLSIVGPSGCGKSTLLRILAGLEPATSGRASFAGKAVERPLGDVGLVFQRDLLLDWRTALDNVLLPAEFRGTNDRATRERAAELLEQLGVGGFKDSYPWQLSGGMRQRVAIARALVCRPAMLLLDEPFSALDALTRDQMNVLLQDISRQQNVTTVLITHSIAEAVFLGDRVLVMSGRPGTILDDIDVSFARPRKLSLREDADFTAIVRRIRIHFERTGVLVG